MLSFEDFFSKKKIDLNALESANKTLFEEFKAHYQLMGEKSFDHSKKFWFNKLRKEFVLKEIETKPVATAVAKIPEKSTEEANPAAGPINESTATEIKKPAGFKPRFKPGVTAVAKVPEKSTEEAPPKPAEDTPINESTDAEIKKPTGFKPRFKPGVTKNNPN